MTAQRPLLARWRPLAYGDVAVLVLIALLSGRAERRRLVEEESEDAEVGQQAGASRDVGWVVGLDGVHVLEIV